MERHKWVRGDIVIGLDNERVYLRLDTQWTCSPNGSNWYPTDAHIDHKLSHGTAIFVGNRSEFE
jgi:hypothetical protein